ncbi:MAG TPA: hypothetical protein VEM14_03295 [Gemmatimonadaceae bacterium]|nr:hypothetical protein [Gemmatimonadaceae bacterium]
MTDYNCLVDSIPNDELPDQKAIFFDTDAVLRAPQQAVRGANDAAFQPTPGLDPRGDLSHAPILHDNWQVIGTHNGDLVTGGDLSGHGSSRTPSVKGLPNNFDAQRADILNQRAGLNL